MTVHVNEIIIRATVNENNDAGHPHRSKKKKEDGDDKDGIVTECVEQVLEILKNEIKR